MLKLLLDENIGHLPLAVLRREGYDVKSVLEVGSGTDDKSILEIAYRENCILVTLDNDFGKLIFRDSHKNVGVIFLRLSLESSERIASILSEVLKLYGEKLNNRFTTVSEKNIRIR